MNSVIFFVPGIPRPQGSKRHVGRGIMVESSKYVADWRSIVSFTAKAFMGDKLPLEGAIELQLAFVFPRPKSHSKKQRESDWHTIKPDLSKLLRAVEDAMTGIVFNDDSQVCRVFIKKLYGENPGVLVSATMLEVRSE